MDNQNLNQTPVSPITPPPPVDNLVPPVPVAPMSSMDAPQKKSPVFLIVVVVFVILVLAGGLYIYSNQAEKLSTLNNVTQYTPPTPLSQNSVTPTPNLQSEVDSISVEDPSTDFKDVDADLSSL